MTIFMLFFGIALLDALKAHHWIQAWLWIAFGAAFLWSDLVERGRRESMNKAPSRK
ncbi:MAG: hypothetical protein ABI625_17130 [bacterium]